MRTLLVLLCVTGHHLALGIPIYGFEGASSAVQTGRTLHYKVDIAKCDLITGSAIIPEFAETFGGHVTTWRSFNDRDISDEPFLAFFDQKMLFNNTGGLMQVSREVEVWGNNSAIVTTVLYTPDFRTVHDMYIHRCSLTAENKTGAISFNAPEEGPARLHGFAELLEALEGGSYVHFMAMTFICHGGREHSFSNFGGHIQNYELGRGEVVSVGEGIRSYVQQLVHYDRRAASHVVDVVSIWMYSNRTVEIVDTRGLPPFTDLGHKHVSYCYLDNGAPGASFEIYA
ncbi:uncharacterized protein LOC128229707 isoform X2 [Mya arenaria]|uniref:uncharacterized protein LOC128229707 isoform X2 n=1 Tax=Mya arenaria TaxID=6604 RepID=UPI0022E76AAA|nr:uncharacterized protein LOC128229707 isoform X2 [Mya arenaria]